MAKKSESFVCGLIEVVPTGGGKRQRNEMSKVERTSKTIFKDKEGGCSTQFTKKHKAEEFVDKNTGLLGYKEEVKFKSTLKKMAEAVAPVVENVTKVVVPMVEAVAPVVEQVTKVVAPMADQ
ncbi:hypothetical protein F0562_030505 [Nyssa sinensis]|uniref:Uncharacterized protein n=1 Tax=Nyssa sinensis TaxID=561372 RepID=A0A5J5B0R9_9ASTE|nr:hypothetical protein F0562_030505 [Nyssa sinensis]